MFRTGLSMGPREQSPQQSPLPTSLPPSRHLRVPLLSHALHDGAASAGNASHSQLGSLRRRIGTLTGTEARGVVKLSPAYLWGSLPHTPHPHLFPACLQGCERLHPHLNRTPVPGPQPGHPGKPCPLQVWPELPAAIAEAPPSSLPMGAPACKCTLLPQF